MQEGMPRAGGTRVSTDVSKSRTVQVILSSHKQQVTRIVTLREFHLRYPKVEQDGPLCIENNSVRRGQQMM